MAKASRKGAATILVPTACGSQAVRHLISLSMARLMQELAAAGENGDAAHLRRLMTEVSKRDTLNASDLVPFGIKTVLVCLI